MHMIEQYVALAGYNRWMNQRLFTLIGELDEAERTRDAGAFFGSIHRTLNHVLLADRIWLGRLTGDRDRYASRDAAGQVIPVESLGQILYEDFGELTAERNQTDAHIDSHVRGLDEQALDAPIHYRNSKGGVFEHPAWWALTHMFNHQTHHRGQVTTLLSQQGVHVGVTDLAIYLRSPR